MKHLMPRLWAITITTALLCLGAVLSAPPAAAAVDCTNRGNALGSGGVLVPGDCLQSRNGVFVLKMQTDGNFVLYHKSSGRACWATGTSTRGDRVFVETYGKTVSIGTVIEFEVVVGANPWWNPLNKRWWITDYDLKDPLSGRDYNLSLNDKGQAWAGYKQIGNCDQVLKDLADGGGSGTGGGGAPPKSTGKYWVTTFQSAGVYPNPNSFTRTGTLNGGRNYVYCKVWGREVREGGAYNSWWLLTDPDSGPAGQYVSAYYLSKWGNNEARDDNGADIRTC